MDRKTRKLIKDCLKQLNESLKMGDIISSPAEDVLVSLVVFGFFEPTVPTTEKRPVWSWVFDRIQKELKPLLPFFSKLHSKLQIPDEVVYNFLTGIKAGNYTTAVLLGAIHEASLEIVNGSPERKKQGSYYTPPEIVRHMVDIALRTIVDDYRNKIWHALREGSKKEALSILDEFRQIKVVDPACGSAAFLSAVLLKLISFYCELPAGIIKESPAVNAVMHLYGTDIDQRAVNLTVLGLVLGCGPGLERTETEKIIALLRQRIRTGNALTLNWQQEFPEVFLGPQPGFDLVIGNPPYISNKMLPVQLKEIINRNYRTAEGQYDIIVPFIEKGLDILKQNGILCYIVSNKYLAADYGRKLRIELLCRHKLLQIKDLSSLKIFTEASVYPVIQVIQKGREGLTGQITVRELKNAGQLKEETEETLVPERFFRCLDDMIITPKLNNNTWSVMEKIASFPGRIPPDKISCGIAKTGFSKAVISGEDYQKLAEGSKTYYRKFLNTGNIDNFSINGPDKYISSAFSTKIQWESFTGRKIVIAGLAQKIEAAVDEESCALGRVYYIREEDITCDLFNNYDLYYLCALLNSSLMNFYYRVLYWPVHLQGGYYRFNSTYLARLPFPPLRNRDC